MDVETAPPPVAPVVYLAINGELILRLRMPEPMADSLRALRGEWSVHLVTVSQEADSATVSLTLNRQQERQ